MTVTLTQAKYREANGRDSMERASLWQGAAGALYGLNLVYSNPTITIGTTTTKARSTATAPFAIGGQLFSKASTDDLWTIGGATSPTVVAVNSWQKYLLMIDDAGAATVQEGVQSSVSAAGVAWTNIATAAAANPKNPWAPLTALLNASRCIFGYITVATDATHTFTPGTTAFTATGITTTYTPGIDPSLFPILADEKGRIVGITV